MSLGKELLKAGTKSIGTGILIGTCIAIGVASDYYIFGKPIDFEKISYAFYMGSAGGTAGRFISYL